MRVSRRTDRVTYTPPGTTTVDEWGQPTDAGGTAVTVSMEVVKETADERIRAGRTEGAQTARFRYLASAVTVEPEGWFTYDGSTWQVRGWPTEHQRLPRYMEAFAVRAE